jgi:alpha-D-xyloside xylohydrolase
MWLVSQGHTVQYAEEIHTTTPCEDNKAVTLLCPTRKIFSRGDTLNLATLSVELEAQFDGVISLEVTHHAGARRLGPDFELFPDGKPDTVGGVKKSADGNGSILTSGALSATVSGDDHTFDIKFHATDGSKMLTSLLNRSVGLAYSPALSTPKQVEDLSAHKHYMFTQTELAVGESIHGLGERFGAWNKIGQHIEVWNEDGGTSSEQAYKNISFWLSSRGYGVFIDTPDKIDLEIGSERSCRLQTTVEGQRLKWYIIYGPTPREVLTKYSILTGKSNRVPAWSYGLWLSTSFTTSYSEDTVVRLSVYELKVRHTLTSYLYLCSSLSCRKCRRTAFLWRSSTSTVSGSVRSIGVTLSGIPRLFRILWVRSNVSKMRVS